MIRWMKFNAVGLMGVAVQLAALALWTRMGVNYLVATALAVETALLHNYFWHTRWTWKAQRVRRAPSELSGTVSRRTPFCASFWKERTNSRGSRWWRFQLSNGLLSLVSNLALMRVLMGWGWLPAVPANLLAIVCTSLLNFWISERWVFLDSARKPPACP